MCFFPGILPSPFSLIPLISIILKDILKIEHCCFMLFFAAMKRNKLYHVTKKRSLISAQVNRDA